MPGALPNLKTGVFIGMAKKFLLKSGLPPRCKQAHRNQYRVSWFVIFDETM